QAETFARRTLAASLLCQAPAGATRAANPRRNPPICKLSDAIVLPAPVLRVTKSGPALPPANKTRDIPVTKRLFVGGLAWATDENSLRTAFERFGEVTAAAIITDPQTGKSRGFGFVTYSDEAAADRAIEELN